MGLKGVPVVMYHGVGPGCPGWAWNHLFTRPDVFEGQMRILREKGWNAVTLDMLYAHMKEGAPLPENPFVLTFDDGYLNNWTFAFPLIKKYGHRAVIWMTTEFIDPCAGPRPTLEDVWNGSMREEELEAGGFLSIAEMRAMEKTGIIDIQSHAATHTWYFGGPEIVDFHRPRGVDGYEAPPWLGWNRSPGRKFEYMSVPLEETIPFGTPIYAHGKSLVTRRYFQDPSLDSILAAHVSARGGKEFFRRADWRRSLERIAGEHPMSGGRFETGDEFASRRRSELAGSRETLGRALGKQVDYLCWPGGGIDDALKTLALEAGYKASTTLFQAEGRRNLFGEDPREINRTGCGAPWRWKGRLIHRTAPGFFLEILRLFNGERDALWKLRLYKIKYMFRGLFLPASGGGA